MEKRSVSPLPCKRKHTTLSLRKKLEIIEAIENRNEKPEILAKVNGVGRSTIYDIYKNKEKIRRSSEKFDDPGLKRRLTTKPARYPQMEEALFIWVLQQRLQQNVLTPDVIKTKAEFFFGHLQSPSETFKASNGWYNRFRNRHGLKMISLSGERASADIAAFERFRGSFSEQVEGLDLSPSQIYNADESALFLKLLPNRTVALQDEDIAAGRKVIKTRCTFMPCANSDGTHKLPLMFLGTAENPRCLPRDKSQLPVYYRHSKKAWMNRTLFNEWFHTQFVPLVRAFSIQQGIAPKALLLLDNCTAHHEGSNMLESDDGLITVAFLPPNCTSEGQPMDQGVINSIKKKYKKKLLLNVVLANDDLSLDERLKKISLADCIEWVAEAWDAIPASTIVNSWKKLNQNDSNQAEPSDDTLNESITLSTLVQTVGRLGDSDCTEEDIRCWENDWVRDASGNWVTGDDGIYTDLEIIAYVNGTENKENDDTMQEEWLDEPKSSTDFQRAVDSVDFLINYLHRENMLSEVAKLHSMKNNILEHEYSKRY